MAREMTASQMGVELGRRGAAKRNENMTAEARSESARKAVEARWAKARAPLSPAPAKRKREE